MNIKSLLLIALSLFLFSCNDKEDRMADSNKASKHNDSVFAQINKNWKFNIPAPHPKVQARIGGWQQWRLFNDELKQKPKSSLNAFRIKAKNLSKRADSLAMGIPMPFNKPAVKSRISTLNTKLKSLETFITLDYIPIEKVNKIIQDISVEVISIQNQMSEIIVKSEIPREEGEEFLLQAMDTTRNARRELQQQEP